MVAAAVDELGPEAGFGPQAVFWLRGPWGTGERVLSLSVNGYRRRQVASLRDALRRSDRSARSCLPGARPRAVTPPGR